MAKKLIAVTEIRHDNDVIEPGATLDASRFDRKQLESLYDAGAVRVEGEDEKPANQNATSAEQSANASSAKNTQAAAEANANATPTPAKSAAAPAPVKGNADVKGNSK